MTFHILPNADGGEPVKALPGLSETGTGEGASAADSGEKTPLLDVCNINYSYHTLDGETLALSNISFNVKQGEFIAIVGPSGCGKSTLLSLISNLLTPDEGVILLNGRPVSRSESFVGYMPQRDQLFEWRSILSNVGLGLEIQKRINPETTKRLNTLLETYGLGDFKKSKPSQLSGGMRQRAAFIRTLVLEPELLLLDEPFSALDYQTRLSVCDDISFMIRHTGKTAILITHDLSEAISMADRIIILSARPGMIKKIMPLSFEQAKTPLERRNAPEFPSYFNQLWKELKQS
ncbi:ATP-binding cassette domain-containing protein [Lachnospiraceae bacterium 62-35]